jgi:hypothetical protein
MFSLFLLYSSHVLVGLVGAHGWLVTSVVSLFFDSEIVTSYRWRDLQRSWMLTPGAISQKKKKNSPSSLTNPAELFVSCGQFFKLLLLILSVHPCHRQRWFFILPHAY